MSVVRATDTGPNARWRGRAEGHPARATRTENTTAATQLYATSGSAGTMSWFEVT